MANGRLSIGWARGGFTPARKTLLQGQFYTRVSNGTLSPLTATAMALEVKSADGTAEQAVFVSCDLTGIEIRPDLLRELEGRCPGLDRRKITLNATHTHAAPTVRRGCYQEPQGDPDFMTPDEFRAWMAPRLADIVEQAWNNRQPGGISRGFGYAVVGRCRRAVYADGKSLMYGDTARADFTGFESCDDHAVNLLFTHDSAGKLTGILVNLACPSQCDEHLTVFSADFWHNVRQGLAARYGEAVHLLPQCAPAGDLSPHLLADKKEETDLRQRLNADAKALIARRILAAVEDSLVTASPPQETLELVHHIKTLRLPRLMVTRAEYELEKRIPSMSEAERRQQSYAFQQIWPFGLMCDLVKRYEQQAANPDHLVETHIIRIGDVVFATNPFELYVDYGMQIRCRSRARQTFLVQLADDTGGYLPTQRAIDAGHYSAIIKSNWVGPAGGKKLVDETVAAIDALFPAPAENSR